MTTHRGHNKLTAAQTRRTMPAPAMMRASAGPSTRRLAMAAPTVLLILIALAPARPTLPCANRGVPRTRRLSILFTGRTLCRSLRIISVECSQVLQIQLFHGLRKSLILDCHIQLIVADPA